MYQLWEQAAAGGDFFAVWEDGEPPSPLVYSHDEVVQEDYIETDEQFEAAVPVFATEAAARAHAVTVSKQPNVNKPTIVNGTFMEVMVLMQKLSVKYNAETGRSLRVDLIIAKGTEIYREVFRSDWATKH